MFKIGEKVVYPVHGAGIIEAIEQKEVLGEKRRYYILRLSVGELNVMVPVDTVDKIGMRPVSDDETLALVKDILQGEASPWEDNWNRRYRENMDKIKSGDICQLAEVVRNLMVRDLTRGLSAGEKKMLETSRKILLSEIVLAKEMPAEEAADSLNRLFDGRRKDDSAPANATK
ncbi:MAG: CarD family transcriptional regulator [Firmicutes bacterium]|nr:CarD family transcriptional regulator [Bacillota bacterium]